MLAPEHLFHPVLPVKLASKCMFALCTACAKDQLEQPWHQRTNLCNHTDQQRQMTGTWCTEELKVAVEKGYRIIHIHEVWHWPEDQRKTGLFRPYVNKFLKAKQESSGYPSDVVILSWGFESPCLRVSVVVAFDGSLLGFEDLLDPLVVCVRSLVLFQPIWLDPLVEGHP